ncbi:DUF885 family protein [Burkholderiaceae bacterium DAT-1]|nr:DUF885 family protein [Burkholderiaceae bacterium DAT-1]
MQMKSSQLLAIGLLVLVSTAQAAKHEAGEDANFRRIYEQEWKWRQSSALSDDPENRGDQESGLPRVNAASQKKALTYWQAVMRKLDRIDVHQLTPEAQTNYQIYRYQLQVLIEQIRFKDYEMPLNADTAFWSQPADEAKYPFVSEKRVMQYLAELRDIPRYFDEQMVNMRAGLARGFTPARVTLQGREVSILALIDISDPKETAFFKPFKQLPGTISPARKQALRDEAEHVIQATVLPAYRKLLTFVRDEYIPHTRETLGARDLPEGMTYYRSKIREFTTLDLSPESIHQTGLAEMASIRNEMHETMRKAGFEGDLPQFLQFLRTDQQFYAKTPDELLKQAAWIAKKFDAKAYRYFGYLPRMRFGIYPVPADQAPFYTSGRGGPGEYLVNTWNLPSRALYSLPALTLHESAPGHAFQMPIAMEQKSFPAFRGAYISAYGEGWALYCERLGVEMGMYDTPYEVFGMLSYQAWRAARLVVDTGIHAMGWTREQAQAYLRDNTALSDHEIETEVDRYISWPGQALSYYLGEMTMFKVRRHAEQALGDKFDLRNFHDTVLQLGSVPLPVLEARIERFIKDKGKSPYPKR